MARVSRDATPPSFYFPKDVDGIRWRGFLENSIHRTLLHSPEIFLCRPEALLLAVMALTETTFID